MKMNKTKIVKEDGRYLIYYEFMGEDDEEQVSKDFKEVKDVAEIIKSYQGKNRKEEGEGD